MALNGIGVMKMKHQWQYQCMKIMAAKINNVNINNGVDA
jgi:hypothetical protein